MEVITENQCSSLHALQAYNLIVHAWPRVPTKGYEHGIKGGGASSAQDLQFQEKEIRNQYRFPLSEPLSSVILSKVKSHFIFL